MIGYTIGNMGNTIQDIVNLDKAYAASSGVETLRIGIPKALLYFIYFPLWKTFLEALGHEVVLSENTNQEILNAGVKSCVDDACLPVKIYHGHVINLIGKADVVLMPRLISVHPGEFICPKFIGLPEMIKNSVPGSPNLLIMEVNAHKQLEKGYHGMKDLGRKLGANNTLINSALKTARSKQMEYTTMLEKGSNPLRLLEEKRISSREKSHRKGSVSKSCKGKIGLIGHPYLVYDQYINMNICIKLEGIGYQIVYPENCTSDEVNLACERYPKKLFWSYGKHLLGSGLSMLEKKQIQGLILISSFGCGIDAFMDELLIRANHREYHLPLTTITLDEHTGEAGFDTRLEAFIDMMEWRSKYDDYISPHGANIYSR